MQGAHLAGGAGTARNEVSIFCGPPHLRALWVQLAPLQPLAVGHACMARHRHGSTRPRSAREERTNKGQKPKQKNDAEAGRLSHGVSAHGGLRAGEVGARNRCWQRLARLFFRAPHFSVRGTRCADQIFPARRGPCGDALAGSPHRDRSAANGHGGQAQAGGRAHREDEGTEGVELARERGCCAQG